MTRDEDESPGGSEILRHKAREQQWEPAAHGIEGAMECVEKHMEAVFGAADFVFHELVSDLVHIDVHHIPPSAGHPYHVMYTTGMGDLPMTIPEGAEVESRAELVLVLPPDWKISQEDFQDERWCGIL